MSIQQQVGTLDIWDGMPIQHNNRITESVLCIAPQELARLDVQLLAGDAQIIRSVDEARGVDGGSYQSVVVLAGGTGIACELLRSQAIDGNGKIHWHLGMELPETLEVLGSVARRNLPPGVCIVGINHGASGPIITTSLTGGEVLDSDSFRRGVAAATRSRVDTTGTGTEIARIMDRLMAEKLLHTLQTVGPLLDTAPLCNAKHDGAAEDQLALIQRKYREMERQYKSLAASKLGKLTLRLWALNRALRRRTASTAMSRKKP